VIENGTDWRNEDKNHLCCSCRGNDEILNLQFDFSYKLKGNELQYVKSYPLEGTQHAVTLPLSLVCSIDYAMRVREVKVTWSPYIIVLSVKCLNAKSLLGSTKDFRFQTCHSE
jgi:hypothetical protein